jgi:hypothetical protein
VVWVDVTGLTYGKDRLPLRPDGTPVPRELNNAWQRDLLGYLRSGEATMLVRPRGTNPSPQTRQVLRSWPVLARSGPYAILGVPPSERSSGSR